ncbi:MAG TPA: hypothetical protein PK280_14070 [Planctomycetota bacterium]|nr:hypothetical protein [Planctomycetota bacterium]
MVLDEQQCAAAYRVLRPFVHETDDCLYTARLLLRAARRIGENPPGLYAPTSWAARLNPCRIETLELIGRLSDEACSVLDAEEGAQEANELIKSLWTAGRVKERGDEDVSEA